MKLLLRSIAATACALILVACQENAPSSEEHGAWLGTLDAAVKEASATKKPILVDFRADWCGPCKQLETQFANAEVQAMLKEFVLLRVDLTERGASPGSDTAAKFNVQFIPDVRILAPDGTQRQLVESREAGAIVKELKKALGK